MRVSCRKALRKWISSGGSSARPSHERYRQASFFASLDGLRCASILAVLWHHAHGGYPWLPGSQRGFLGVDLFFVISGFLIVTLLLRERSDTGSVSLRHFYLRRTLRIFPPYYLVLVIFCAAYILVRPAAPRAAVFFSELPYYASYTSNWIAATAYPIAWSLAAEEQFYLLWPPVEKFLRRWVLWILGGILVASQLVNFGWLDPLSVRLSTARMHLSMLQVTFTPICLGVAAAHLLHAPRSFALAARLFGHSFTVPFLWTVLIILANLPNPDVAGAHRLVLQLAMACLVVASVLDPHRRAAAPFHGRPAARIGRISYGVYLFHPFCVSAALALLPQGHGYARELHFLLTLVLSILVAEVSFRLLERRFESVRRRLRPGSGQGNPTQAGASAPTKAVQ